jgi:hypothetical protein
MELVWPTSSISPLTSLLSSEAGLPMAVKSRHRKNPFGCPATRICRRLAAERLVGKGIGVLRYRSAIGAKSLVIGMHDPWLLQTRAEGE